MRKVLIILFLTLMPNTWCQKIVKVCTSELIPIAEKSGIDSALQKALYLPFYSIDSIVALKIISYIHDYKEDSRIALFFAHIAQNWRSPILRNKTLELLKSELIKGKKSEPDKYGYLPVLDYKLLICVIKQKPDSIDYLLNDSYNYWNNLADSLKDNFPPRAKRFLLFFRGEYPIKISYNCCNENCYKIQWTLKNLKSNFFSSEELEFHRRNLYSRQIDEDPMRFKENSEVYDEKKVTLKNNYESVSEIDFDNEPDLIDMVNMRDTSKCHRFLISNKNYGILDIGCYYGPLSAYGFTYLLELTDRNQLTIKVIDGFIA